MGDFTRAMPLYINAESIADQINSGEFENLDDFDWEGITGWFNIVIERLVELVNDEKIKVAILNCAIAKWNLACYRNNSLKLNNDFGGFCQNLKQQIESHKDYDIGKLQNEGKHPTTQSATDRLLNNKKFVEVLKKAIKAEFVIEVENDSYRWNQKYPLQYANLFANNAVKNKHINACNKVYKKDIEELFGTYHLATYRNRLKSKDHTAQDIERQINSLFP